MIKGIYHAGRSLTNNTKNLERIANNLANINTVGFKREGLFIEILKQAGNSEIKIPIDLKQGNLAQTGNPLDLAISGDGYFVISNDGKYELTRNGSFMIDDDGFLVTKEGKRVIGKAGEINLLNYKMDNEQILSIDEEGEIKVGDIVIDKLLIINQQERFADLGNIGLKYDDLNDLLNSSSEADYKIMQGYLEESNVNPIEEMELMIKVSKDYEASYRIVQSLDDSIQKANEIGKV